MAPILHGLPLLYQTNMKSMPLHCPRLLGHIRRHQCLQDLPSRGFHLCSNSKIMENLRLNSLDHHGSIHIWCSKLKTPWVKHGKTGHLAPPIHWFPGHPPGAPQTLWLCCGGTWSPGQLKTAVQTQAWKTLKNWGYEIEIQCWHRKKRTWIYIYIYILCIWYLVSVYLHQQIRLSVRQ